jgi:hypothetical protein
MRAGRHAFLRALAFIPVFFSANLTVAEETPDVVPRQDIRDLVTPEQYAKMGLDKLDAAELQELNLWLYGHVRKERREAVQEVIPQGEDSFGLEDIPAKISSLFDRQPELIESRLLNENFTGWDGKTVFRLENGQVWKQIDMRRFYYPTKDPVVEIRKALSGAYYLKLKNKGSQTTVRRIQ